MFNPTICAGTSGDRDVDRVINGYLPFIQERKSTMLGDNYCRVAVDYITTESWLSLRLLITAAFHFLEAVSVYARLSGTANRNRAAVAVIISFSSARRVKRTHGNETKTLFNL